MKPFPLAFLVSAFCLGHPGTVASVQAGGSAKTSANSSFSFSGSAQKVALAGGKFAYLGNFSMQTYVAHDLVHLTVLKWSQGSWAGHQATLLANATVKVERAGKSVLHHGPVTVLFVDNNHGQNSNSANQPACDCVCVSWKDSVSSLSYNLLGTVARGGTAIVR